MSEQTGATMIAVAVERCDGCGGRPEHSIACLRCHEQGVRFRRVDGYRIVPADAVVVTPEIAAVAAEACENRANSLDGGLHESGWSYGAELTARIRRDVEHYRAAAAALRGEG